MTHFLQPSISLRSLRKGFQSSSSFLHSDSIGIRSFSCKMSADSPIPSQSITLPCQLEQPVQILAAPGVSDSDFRNAVDSSLFKQWLLNLQSETGILAKGALSLKQVLIQGVDMFGSRIGFLKFKADIYDKETGKKVRVPVGKLMLELPAGMLDDDKGDFVGTAVREVEEEIGIQLKLEDMVDLTGFLDPSTGCRVFPSPPPLISSNNNPTSQNPKNGRRRKSPNTSDETIHDDENPNEHKKKKIIHRDVERQRRQEMSTLYSTLRSLLPVEYVKGKRSICDHMHETVKYIQYIQNNIQKLSNQRDELKKNFGENSNTSTVETLHSSKRDSVVVRPRLGGFQVVLDTATHHRLSISNLVNFLLSEKLKIISCISTKINDREILLFRWEKPQGHDGHYN